MDHPKHARGFLDPWTLGLVVALIGGMSTLALRDDNTGPDVSGVPAPADTPRSETRPGNPVPDIEL